MPVIDKKIIFLKVLHISGHTSWGGSEQQLLNTIEELSKYDVQQLAFCFSNTPTYKALGNTQTEIFAIDKVKPHKLEYLRFLARIVKENQVDLIHLHTSDALTGYVLCDILYSLHTPTIFSRKQVRNKASFLSKLKYNYKNVNKIICVSEFVRDHFKKVIKDKNKEKLVVVRDGVDLNENEVPAPYKLKEKLNIPDSIVLIGNIANHTRAKDLKTLIRAVHYLVNDLKLTDFHLVQMGEFSKRTDDYKNLVNELKIDPYITFMGFTENASRFLPQFDVFTMSSEREGGPSSVIESFYHKTPVVSTKVGIIEETIVDGRNGFSAEVGDYKKLAEGLKKLAGAPYLREEFAEKNYKMFLENFTAERLGENTYEVYKEVLKN